MGLFQHYSQLTVTFKNQLELYIVGMMASIYFQMASISYEYQEIKIKYKWQVTWLYTYLNLIHDYE